MSFTNIRFPGEPGPWLWMDLRAFAENTSGCVTGLAR
jgi:hypothetical protein